MNQIINDILSSSIALGIIAFICKMILKHMDKRGLETYKNKLKIESDLLAKRIDLEFSQKKEREIELGRWGLTLLSSVIPNAGCPVCAWRAKHCGLQGPLRRQYPFPYFDEAGGK